MSFPKSFRREKHGNCCLLNLDDMRSLLPFKNTPSISSGKQSRGEAHYRAATPAAIISFLATSASAVAVEMSACGACEGRTEPRRGTEPAGVVSQSNLSRFHVIGTLIRKSNQINSLKTPQMTRGLAVGRGALSFVTPPGSAQELRETYSRCQEYKIRKTGDLETQGTGDGRALLGLGAALPLDGPQGTPPLVAGGGRLLCGRGGCRSRSTHENGRGVNTLGDLAEKCGVPAQKFYSTAESTESMERSVIKERTEEGAASFSLVLHR